ncbi:MAG: amino acid ABC transporter substrate-binding protein [Pedobacter sp.]|nr:amino acid ABC transporter substrate-binding protein [Pedobacter sp.]
MILAQNHQQRLSGNKYWVVFLLSVLFASCSPKLVKTVKKQPKPPEKVEETVMKPVAKFTEATISLLVPFRLSSLNLKTATKAEVEKSAMAIDFYQGFMLGLDSAASAGFNFKLRVFDAGDNSANLETLIQNGSLANSNLIVGPVYPDGLRHIRSFTLSKNITLVNPLAATNPKELNNPNMITIVNNIQLHAEKIGEYIVKHIDPVKSVVVLINPKGSDDELMAAPIRKFFEDPKQAFFFQEFSSVYNMDTRMIKNKKYVVVLASSERKFVTATIDKLIKMKNAGLSVDLYGHPDWTKQTYNTEKLQTLNAIVSASYKIDFSRKDVSAFIKKYRSKYHFEPGEYSYKGFDTGFYFANLIATHGKNYAQFLTKEKYKGLHNSFSFVYDPKMGYLNTSLMLLKYQNFALNIIE